MYQVREGIDRAKFKMKPQGSQVILAGQRAKRKMGCPAGSPVPEESVRTMEAGAETTGLLTIVGRSC